MNVNTEESTKRVTIPLAFTKRQQCVPSLSVSGEFEDDRDYENCEKGEMFLRFTNSGRSEDVNACLAASETSNEGINRNSEAPALPLKNVLSLTGENTVEEVKPHGTSRPVPKPRKRLVGKVGSQEMCKDSHMVQTQWQGEKIVEITDSAQLPGISSTENGFEEICPELPHKPIFLLTSQEDIPPPLPPKNGKKTYPEQQHNAENKDEKEPLTRGETPPPALPLKNKSVSDNHLGLAYLEVDVSDWKTVEDNYYGVYAEVKDDGRVFRPNGNGKWQQKLLPRSDLSFSQKGTSASHPKNNESNIWMSARRKEECIDTEDYVVMKGQISEAKTTYEYMQRLRSGEAYVKPQLVNRQVEEGNSEDDEPYEVINYSYESSQTESRLKMNTDNQDKVAVKMQTKHSSSNNSSSHNANCSVQTSLQNGTSGASRPRNNNKNIWISARREEDCMDFKDLGQFSKLRKQLNDTRSQVKNLEKQVALKEQDPTKGKRMLLETSDVMTFCISSNSQHPDKESKDENTNKLEKKKENLTSVVTVPENAGLITQEGEVSKPNVSEYCDDYHDHDVYVECYDRKYANQGNELQNNSVYYMNVDKNEQSSGDIDDDGIKPIYYNTVEIETMSDRTSRYLQLGNSSDKDKIFYLNVDDQDDDQDVEEKPFRTKEMTNRPSKSKKKDLENKLTIIGNSVFNRSLEDVTVTKESDITKPPPLPPKQRPVGSSALRDFRT